MMYVFLSDKQLISCIRTGTLLVIFNLKVTYQIKQTDLFYHLPINMECYYSKYIFGLVFPILFFENSPLG